jgi:hypothetical protein
VSKQDRETATGDECNEPIGDCDHAEQHAVDRADHRKPMPPEAATEMRDEMADSPMLGQKAQEIGGDV